MGILPAGGLRTPIALAAFEGWNDAGEAASMAIDHLIETWDTDLIFELDPEEYHDFQVNRPVFAMGDDGTRVLTWPTTRVYLARGETSDVVLVRGVEPSMKWLSFADEIMAVLTEAGCESLVMLGAMLGDVPHTRPLPVDTTCDDDSLRERLTASQSMYEGPAGILSVLGEAARGNDFDTLSLWVTLPQYVGQTPSPKGALALLDRIEELTDSVVDLDEISDEAQAWEHAVSTIAAQDDEIASFVMHLEEEVPALELPQAKGDAIARDFARYLKRRLGG